MREYSIDVREAYNGKMAEFRRYDSTSLREPTTPVGDVIDIRTLETVKSPVGKSFKVWPILAGICGLCAGVAVLWWHIAMAGRLGIWDVLGALALMGVGARRRVEALKAETGKTLGEAMAIPGVMWPDKEMLAVIKSHSLRVGPAGRGMGEGIKPSSFKAD